MVSGAAVVVKVYSQNGKFYLKSIPYDDQTPSLKGETSVYERGATTPLYTLDRGFDVHENISTVILSNDGEVIFNVVQWGGDETKEGLKSVNVYKHGRLSRSYTETEITGCDKKKERCDLIYYNFDKVVDPVKSNLGTRNFKRVLKDGIDEKERFLSDFALFSFDDNVYLTDWKKRIHIFDLRDGRLTESDSFDTVFDRIKTKGRFIEADLESYKAPVFLDFPKLKDGTDTHTSLANYIGMIPSSVYARTPYKKYVVDVTSTISRDGTVEIEAIDIENGLPKEKILEFFKTNKFDTSSIPNVFPKWEVGRLFLYFRKKSKAVARQEARQESAREQRELEQRLKAERIDGVYIPANLGECFVELDKELSEIDKQEMKALPERDDMIRYHLGLGTWMRNSWRLWAGSRLSKYFADKGVNHPESMSSIILYHYYDWLNNRKDTWKEWEKNPRKRVP